MQCRSVDILQNCGKVEKSIYCLIYSALVYTKKKISTLIHESYHLCSKLCAPVFFCFMENIFGINFVFLASPPTDFYRFTNSLAPEKVC